MPMKTLAALTLGRALALTVAIGSATGASSRGTAQPDPDRECQAGLDELAADHSHATTTRSTSSAGIGEKASKPTRRTPASKPARRWTSTSAPIRSARTRQIYRMGYYGGAGARLVRSLGPFQGTTEPTPQDGARSLIECNWKVGFSLEIPKDWVSGVYLGKLSTLPAPAGQYLDREMAARATSSSSSATTARPTCSSRPRT